MMWMKALSVYHFGGKLDEMNWKWKIHANLMLRLDVFFFFFYFASFFCCDCIIHWDRLNVEANEPFSRMYHIENWIHTCNSICSALVHWIGLNRTFQHKTFILWTPSHPLCIHFISLSCTFGWSFFYLCHKCRCTYPLYLQIII